MNTYQMSALEVSAEDLVHQPEACLCVVHVSEHGVSTLNLSEHQRT